MTQQVNNQPATTNNLFDVLNPRGPRVAGARQNRTREVWVARYPEDGSPARARDFILLKKLLAGDTGPTPEAIMSDSTYDDGTVQSVMTGVNNGTKTLPIEAGGEDPQCRFLLDHCILPGYGVPGLAGELFAYIYFNADGSSFSGGAKVNTASNPREGTPRWEFGVGFETVDLRRPAQNPLVVAGDENPTGELSVASGPVGTVVTVNGEDLTEVDAVNFGDEVIARAEFEAAPVPSANQFAFAVPAGLAAGDYAVELVSAEGGAVQIGIFTVTAA